MLWLYSGAEVHLTRSVSHITFAIACLTSLSGCWQLDPAEVPLGAVDFAPEGQDAPDGWRVLAMDMQIDCPDGEEAKFYFVYPVEAETTGLAVPAAVVYGAGAFDFVFAPTTEEPLAGTHYATPSRLDHAWAVRNVFTTLGMLPDEIENENQTGALPIALAEQGVAMLFPANCWGDMWHNRGGLRDNDFPADFFSREGRTVAEWGYQVLADPNVAAALQIELPIAIDATEVYAIGLGDGGRAVTELLSVDANKDGIADYSPAGALVDSTADDLSIFFRDPSRYGNRVAGLNRIFPYGNVSDGSLATATLPERFGYLYAMDDAEVPQFAHVQAMDILLDDPTKWVYVESGSRHGLLNSDDLTLARDAVIYLRQGTVPTSGDGIPAQ